MTIKEIKEKKAELLTLAKKFDKKPWTKKGIFELGKLSSKFQELKEKFDKMSKDKIIKEKYSKFGEINLSDKNNEVATTDKYTGEITIPAKKNMIEATFSLSWEFNNAINIEKHKNDEKILEVKASKLVNDQNDLTVDKALERLDELAKLDDDKAKVRIKNEVICEIGELIVSDEVFKKMDQMIRDYNKIVDDHKDIIDSYNKENPQDSIGKGNPTFYESFKYENKSSNYIRDYLNKNKDIDLLEKQLVEYYTRNNTKEDKRIDTRYENYSGHLLELYGNDIIDKVKIDENELKEKVKNEIRKTLELDDVEKDFKKKLSEKIEHKLNEITSRKAKLDEIEFMKKSELSVLSSNTKAEILDSEYSAFKEKLKKLDNEIFSED